MAARTLFRNASLRVVDYCCTARPADAPFVEAHPTYTLAFVRRGSFGVRSRGKVHELVPGSLFVGRAADEYMCVHEHHACGDECLSFQWSEEAIEDLRAKDDAWRITAVPPIAELVVLGELAESVARATSDVSIDEAGLLLAARFADVVQQRSPRETTLSARDRRRAVDAACWIEGNAHEPVALADVAHHAGLSAFHFLRLFRAALGVTPHQYLVRCRLRRAARLLAEEDRAITDVAYDAGFGDLSNFTRTFTRAARMSPRAFRTMGRHARRAATARLQKAI